MESESDGFHGRAVERILSPLSLVARAYARIRFRIISREILATLEQSFPKQGTIVDLGCGYGLFATYFAARNPGLQFLGVDLSPKRIAAATSIAAKLGLKNVRFLAGSAGDLRFERIDAAYMIDLLHHIPPQAGNSVLRELYQGLLPGGRLIVKDVTTYPRRKLYFTFVLDLLMCPRDSFYYRSVWVWRSLIERIGFQGVTVHPLWGAFPFPHVLLTATKPG